MAYTYDPIFAADPNNPAMVAKNAAITIFNPADVTMAPVTITDATGSPLPNPITVNAAGFGPAFQHPTLDRVGWSGGGFSNYFTSYEGIKNVAIAAQTAAAASAIAASASSALVGAPADTAVQTLINASGSSTRGALNATYGPLVEATELQPFTVYGNSYTSANSTAIIPDGTQFFYRVKERLRMQALTNRGVPGTRMDEIAERIAATWAPNSRGFVGLCATINDPRQYGDATGLSTTTESFRAALAFLTSSASVDKNSASFAFDSSWTNGVSSTAGGHVDIAWTGDTAYIRLSFGVTGGVATIKNAAGTTLATVTTSGYKNPFTGVVKISGLGSGSHSVRLQITSGTVTVAGVLIPSPTPPTIIWQQEGPVPESSSTINNLLTGTYQPACAAVATADFPTVVQVAAGNGWDGAAMTGLDQLHPNDLGSAYYANRIIAALRAITWRQGQNWVTKSGEATYSIPTAAYTVAGATNPAAATALAATTANQAALTWTRSSNDNGSTITSQLVQWSPAGAGTWTTAATLTPSATSYTITSGLTQSSSYDFRVVTVTAVGQTPSATSTATAGASITVYAADNFDRADSATTLGTTSTGGLSYAVASGIVLGISGNRAYRVSATVNPVVGLLNPGVANGTVKLKVATAGAMGIAFRENTATGGYLFRRNDSGFAEMDKRTASTTYVSLNTTATPVASGDLLEVVMNGSTLIGKVNGATVCTVTDSTYSSNLHGIWLGDATCRADDLEINSAIA